MAGTQTQISAFISEGTKEQVEEYAEAHGLKKAHLVEDALLHHLLALKELPADVIIPPRFLVPERTARDLLARVEKPRKPSRAMRDLLKR